VPTTKSTLFAVSRDQWYTKEGTVKSMKNAAVWQNAPLGLKRYQIAKKSSS